MSLKAEQSSDTEFDHIRDTLTDIVGYVSGVRAEMHQRFDQQEKRLDQHDERFDLLDKRFDQQDKEMAELKAGNAEIKETLKLILSRLPS